MKIFSSLFILFFMSCNSTTENLSEDLMGRWDMKDVIIFNEDRTRDLNPNSDRWIQFYPDQTFISGGSLGRNTGRFHFEEGELFLDSDAGEGDDSQWKISIKNDSLIMIGLGTDRQESSSIYNTRSIPDIPSLSLDIYDIPSSSRALEIAEDGTVWFAGASGKWGYSSDKGKSWNTGTINYQDKNPNFRALEITGDAVFLLSIESPALLYKSVDQGKNWNLVYQEEGEGVFYDAMESWDNNRGIAVGDALDACISIILTEDGGNTWQKIPCHQLPPALNNEGCFAASDTNIKTLGKDVWIGTSKSRIYHSPDYGLNWEVFDTPITNDTETSGIFSVDFYDSLNGMIIGGDFSNPEKNEANLAKTTDGGKTWELLSVNEDPDYRSSLRFVPGTNGNQLWAVGFQGISYSGDGGKKWNKISEGDFYTIRLNIDGKSGWLSGNKKIASWRID